MVCPGLRSKDDLRPAIIGTGILVIVSVVSARYAVLRSVRRSEFRVVFADAYILLSEYGISVCARRNGSTE